MLLNIIQNGAPLVKILESLNVINFLPFYPIFIKFASKCMVCHDL